MSFNYKYERFRGPTLSSTAISVRSYIRPDATFYTGGDGSTTIPMDVGIEVDNGDTVIELTGTVTIGAVHNDSFSAQISQSTVGGITIDGGKVLEDYKFRFFCIHPVSSEKIFSHTVNYKSQEFITPENITESDYQLFLTAPTKIRGIHGSLLLGQYVWGSSRYTNDGCLVKVNKDDYSDTTVFMMYTSSEQTSRINTIEQIVSVGNYIYGQYPDGIFRFNTVNDTYQVYETFPSSGTQPIGTDGEYLYCSQGSGWDVITKYAVADFNDGQDQWNAQGVVTPVDTYDSSSQGGYIDNPMSGYTAIQKGACHSVVIDGTHLYVAYTSNNDFDPTLEISISELHKVNKSTMSADGWVYIPKCTDDMTQTDTHVFLGIETATSYPQTYGYGWGTFNVKKSDLTVNPIAPLSNFDTDGNNSYGETTSYASLIFGDYLIDMKVDSTFYILDISNPDDWSLDKPSGEYTLGRFTLPITASGQPLSGLIPNDIVLDAPQQIFHAFTFNKPASGNSPSGLVRFQIPDFIFLILPSLELMNVEMVDGSLDVILTANISNGGGTLINSGFRFGTDENDLSIVYNVTPDGNSQLVYTLTDLVADTTYYYQAFAENEKGPVETTVASFTSASMTYTITGSVFLNGVPTPDVILTAQDISDNTQTTVVASDENGDYLLPDLIENHEYLVSGYYIDTGSGKKYRVLSKILTPTLSI